MVFCALILLLGAPHPIWSQPIYSYLSSGQIYKTDPVTCISKLLCTQNVPVILTDIAWSDGIIYGVTPSPQGVIFAFDTLTGNLNFMTFSVQSKGLASDGLGNLYLIHSDGDLYKYHISTNTLSHCGPVGICAGDLAFKDDTLFMIDNSYILRKITLNPFGYSIIDTLDFCVPDSSSHSFGLALVHTAEIHSLVASVHILGDNKLYLVNSADATTTPFCSGIPGPGEIYGLASIPLTTGVPDDGKPDVHFSIWPNPANQFLVIQTGPGATGEFNISVQNLQGREMISLSVEITGQHILDLSQLGSGVYSLTLQNARGQTTRKFVVQ